MMSISDLPSHQTLVIAGAGAALALLVAFTAIVDDAVKTGQSRVLGADVGPRAMTARTAPAGVASLQAAPSERRAAAAR